MKKLLRSKVAEGVFSYLVVSLVGKPVYVTDLHTQLVRVFTDFRICLLYTSDAADEL